MSNHRGPVNKRRFDVVIPSKSAPRQRHSAQRHHQHKVNGTNYALIDAGIVVATTLITTVLLLATSGQLSDTTSANLIPQPAAPLSGVIPTQPAPPPSSTISTPSAQPTRTVAIPSPATETAAPAGTPDDTEIQAAIEKRLGDDASLSALDITATVTDGKVILVGTAPSDEIKGKIEKLIRAIRGVKEIDNQIVVISNL